jgi:hypothetical protein
VSVCSQTRLNTHSKSISLNCLQWGLSCGYSGTKASTLNSQSVQLTEGTMQLGTLSIADNPLSEVRYDLLESLSVNLCRESKMLFNHC